MSTQAKNTTARRFLGRPLAAATIVCLAASMAVGIGASSATAATLTNASAAVSNNQAGATSVTWTVQLTTTTTGTIGKVSIQLPPTTGTLGLGTVYGLGAGVVAASGGANTTLSYNVTSPQTVAAGTPIYIEFTGMNNPGAQAFSPIIRTFDNAATPLLIDDAVVNNGLTFGGNNTAATVQVAKSLTFTNDTPAYTLLMDPSLPALADIQKGVNLGVKTNAGQGYSISVKNIGLKTAGTGAAAYTIPASGLNVANGSFAANATGNAIGNMVSNGSALSSSTFVGGWSGLSAAGSLLASATKPTGNTADTIALVNRVKIDYSTPAGTYTDTVTYTAVPAY